MPRIKEITAEEDSLDPCSPATDEEAIRPHQFQAFKKTEYDNVHLNPGKSVLKVLWERVSAEIAQRSGQTIQAGVKGSLTVKKAWSPPTTHYEETPVSQQQLHSAEEKPTAAAGWDHVSKGAWDHVSTDRKTIANMQAGVKESLTVKKPWTPPTTHYEETPISRQQLHSAEEKPTAEAGWDRVSKVAWDHVSTDHKTIANMQAGYPAVDKGKEEPEQQLIGSDQGISPSLATREPAQVVWDRGITAVDRKNVADLQDDNISYTGSREEEAAEIDTEREGDNLSVDKYNPERQRQLEEDVKSSEKPQNQGTEDRISSKTQDSTSDFAPRGEQDDQDSVEEQVTTYDAVTKEQLGEHICLAADPKHMVKKRTPSFGTQENACRLTDYLEERILFKEEAERNQYTVFMMDSQQTDLPAEKIQEDVKPRHTLHEDVPRSKTMDFLPCISDPETKGDGSEEEEVGEAGEEVPYLSYNPPEVAQKTEEVDAAPDTAELQETTSDEKIEALRKELETLEGYDDEEDTCLFDEESLSLSMRQASLPQAADGRTYVMPDPVRARLDDEVLLYHVPRSPEAPRRFTDKVFFRFK